MFNAPLCLKTFLKNVEIGAYILYMVSTECRKRFYVPFNLASSDLLSHVYVASASLPSQRPGSVQ